MSFWSSWASWGPSASYQQGYNARAKQSTRLLATGASAVACNTDVSQYLTNLSTNVTYCFEASTTRFNRGSPRTIGFDLTCSNANTGTLYRHGSGSNTETFGFSSANNLRIVVNNATVITQTLTVLTGSSDHVVIAWTQLNNPDTTGASDAVLSWVHVWNVTAGTYEKFSIAHAAKTLQAGATAVWGANTHPAGTAFNGTILGWWFENRCQTATEIGADWVATLTPPSSNVVTDPQGFPPQASTIDSQNYHHGPAVAWVCDATRRMERRTLQWLRNLVFRPRPTWTDALLDGTDAFIRGVPGSSGDRMHLGWLEPAAVPDNCNRLWVRVHLRSWTTSGDAVPVRVRCHSFSKPPGSFSLAGEPGANDPLEHYFVGDTITRDDDSSVSEWTVLGSMPIARGKQGIDEGITYLALSLYVDPSSASANDANARLTVNALQVVPYYREDQNPLPVHP